MSKDNGLDVGDELELELVKSCPPTCLTIIPPSEWHMNTRGRECFQNKLQLLTSRA